MSKLPEQLIIETEEAILSDKLMSDDYDNLPAISYRDYEDIKYGWDLINKSDAISFNSFVSTISSSSSNVNVLITFLYSLYIITSFSSYIVLSVRRVLDPLPDSERLLMLFSYT